MVVVQILAFGRVQDNRVRKKGAKAAKSERERRRMEKLGTLQAGGMEDSTKMNGATNGAANGIANGNGNCKTIGTPAQSNGGAGAITEPETEASMTETSEEEMML